jgi:hypothetical protein
LLILCCCSCLWFFYCCLPLSYHVFCSPYSRSFSAFVFRDRCSDGPDLASFASMRLTELALHCHAFALKTPLVARAHDVDGHFRSASQMNKVPGRYWKPKPDLGTSIQQHSKLLNPQPAPNPIACLISFEFGSSRWGSLGDATIRTRRDEDGTLYSGSGLGHSKEGGRGPSTRVLIVGLLGCYGAHIVWSPS